MDTLFLAMLLPHARNGRKEEKNVAWVRGSCDASKGDLQVAKYDVPRLAESKYLKLLYELFDHAGVLGVTEDDLHARFCPDCGLAPVCAKEHSVGKLSPLCLDGVTKEVLRPTP